MTRPKQDLYVTLGVDREATPEEVKRAYRKAAMSAHPDHGGTTEQLALVKLAADVLGDARRRGRYDSTGDAEEKPIDNEVAGALELLSSLIMQALDAAMEKNLALESFDLIEYLTRNLKKKRADAAEMLEGTKRARAKLKKLAGRFRRKRREKGEEEPAYFEMIIAQNLRLLAGGIERNEASIRNIDRALAIAAEHQFERSMGFSGWPRFYPSTETPP